jgi:hypothetical protein
MQSRLLILLIGAAALASCGSGTKQNEAATGPHAAQPAQAENASAELSSAWLAGRWQAGEAGACGAGDTYFDLQPNGRYSFMEEQGRWSLEGDRLTIEVTHASSDSGTEVGQRNTTRVKRLGDNEAEWTREGAQPLRVTRCP